MSRHDLVSLPDRYDRLDSVTSRPRGGLTGYGYGEDLAGSLFNGIDQDRAQLLLIAERGHYELAQPTIWNCYHGQCPITTLRRASSGSRISLISEIDEGQTIRLYVPAVANAHWSVDGWKQISDLRLNQRAGRSGTTKRRYKPPPEAASLQTTVRFDSVVFH